MLPAKPSRRHIMARRSLPKCIRFRGSVHSWAGDQLRWFANAGSEHLVWRDVCGLRPSNSERISKHPRSDRSVVRVPSWEAVSAARTLEFVGSNVGSKMLKESIGLADHPVLCHAV